VGHGKRQGHGLSPPTTHSDDHYGALESLPFQTWSAYAHTRSGGMLPRSVNTMPQHSIRMPTANADASQLAMGATLLEEPPKADRTSVAGAAARPPWRWGKIVVAQLHQDRSWVWLFWRDARTPAPATVSWSPKVLRSHAWFGPSCMTA